MASSTFKGRYEECSNCVFQFYDEIKNKYNCKHSHSMIRKNANGVGVRYERYFRYCGLKQHKSEQAELVRCNPIPFVKWISLN